MQKRSSLYTMERSLSQICNNEYTQYNTEQARQEAQIGSELFQALDEKFRGYLIGEAMLGKEYATINLNPPPIEGATKQKVVNWLKKEGFKFSDFSSNDKVTVCLHC